MLPVLIHLYLKQTICNYYFGDLIDSIFILYYINNDNFIRDMTCAAILLFACDDNNVILPYIKNLLC